MASTKKKKRKAVPESPRRWYADHEGNIVFNKRWALQHFEDAFSNETLEEMRKAAERQIGLGSSRQN